MSEDNIRDEWGTNQGLYNLLDSEFHFDLDAAANERNHKCEAWLGPNSPSADYDALARCVDWSLMGSRIFLNPPYSDMGPWLMKAYNASLKGATVVCIVSHDHSTAWWHDWAMAAREIRHLIGTHDAGGRFHSGRVAFEPPPGIKASTNNKPTTVLVFGPPRSPGDSGVSYVDWKAAISEMERSET